MTPQQACAQSTAWAQLPNAALIDTLLAALPAAPKAARDAAWDAARDAAWVAARGAAWDAAWVAARGAACALVAWDDMPGYIALGDAELGALRAVGAGTDVAHKALSAQLYKLLTAHYKENT